MIQDNTWLSAISRHWNGWRMVYISRLPSSRLSPAEYTHAFPGFLRCLRTCTNGRKSEIPVCRDISAGTRYAGQTGKICGYCRKQLGKGVRNMRLSSGCRQNIFCHPVFTETCACKAKKSGRDFILACEIFIYFLFYISWLSSIRFSIYFIYLLIFIRKNN